METEPRDGARALLVGIEKKADKSGWTARDSLEELGRLAATDGLTVTGSIRQKLIHPHPSTYLGSGKVEELKEALLMREAQFVVFDDDLSAGQHKTLEKMLGDGVRIVDRTGLILDIFNRHAHSREGKLQVELAHLKYLLPRLSGLRADLAQQVGGSGAGLTGLRGPGETQLELDRRRMRKRIQKLARELKDVRVHRDQSRRQRERAGVPVVSIVGYTNAGKSSLLNALTGAGVLVEDKLFATLDPTTRRLRLPGGREILLSDTVGFIRKLPHELIASFRATLEGIEEAALLLHVVDASHPRAPDMISTVESVLTELRMIRAPHLVVWNKIDALSAGGDALILPQTRHRSVAVSAKTAENLPALLSTIEEMLTENLSTLEVVIPYGRYELVSAAYAQGTVESREETGEGVRLRLSVPGPLARRLDEFCLPRSGVKSRGGTGPAGLARARRPLLPLDAAEAQTAEMAPGPKPGNGEAEEVAETH